MDPRMARWPGPGRDSGPLRNSLPTLLMTSAYPQLEPTNPHPVMPIFIIVRACLCVWGKSTIHADAWMTGR